MNRLSLLLVIVLAGCSRFNPLTGPLVPNPGDPPRRTVPALKKVIVVMAGQSNMLGVGQTTPFAADPMVRMVFVGGNPYAMVGPGASAAVLYAQAHPYTQVIGVMCAKGSTSINEWGPGSALLEACLSRVQTIRDAENATVVGMMWDQGEQDAAQTPVDTTWGLKLRTLVNYSAGRLHLPYLNVVYDQIGVTDDMSYIASWDQFKALQPDAEDARTAMITTDDLPIVAHVHHDYDANLEIGRRFYNRMLNWENV